MGCFRKTMAVMAVLALILSSIAIIGQGDRADAAGPVYYDAEVTPFTFPECEGTPVLEALEHAEKTIDVSVYLLTSVYVLSMLIEKQSQGVKVRVLIEGQPIEYDIGTYDGTRIFRNLVDEGGEVHIINYKGCGTQTYTNLHNKYAVIDGETVVLTSENWTATNFSSHSENRGWGAVIKSTGYAQYMGSVFDNDFDESRTDVKRFTDVYPELTPYTGELSYRFGKYSAPTYTAKVSPAVTFDNASVQLKALISSATDRLYSEQLNITDSFIDIPVDNPYAWMLERADAGIDTRLVLNTYYDTSDDHRYAEKVKYINDNTPIIASGSPEGDHGLIHNKGLVVDDRTWVGSMNWTVDSINDSREANVIIQSPKVSDFYAETFLLDLYSGYVPGGGKEVRKVTYTVDGKETALNHIKGDRVVLPDDPVKGPESVYTYTFSHWDGYTEGMVADKDVVLTAVFDRHDALDDNPWFAYVIIVLAVIAALTLCTWYVRHGRDRSS
ncbi:MAG: phospholipase D-like domain-containing protein [archaeon]|nr:phospholipase D-like domain-containing protein [archaeon]